MKRSTLGLVIAVIAGLSFGMSGALVKPLLEAGWSPAAAVTARVLIGGLALTPSAIFSLRGRWVALWRARWRVLAMGLIGVAATQLLYFASLERIPVSTAILIEYLAPLMLVGFVWVTSRRMPRLVVLVGSVIAVTGLVLVVSPGGGGLDVLGLVLALLAAVGCAVYFVVAARPSEGLPPVAFAAAGLLVGAAVLGIAGVVRVVPFAATFGTAHLFGADVPWFVPLLIVGIIATAVAYATSITASEILGSRLASFAGLLEVVAAAFYAWILLGEDLSIPQLIGGVLILAGIAFVRAERRADAPIEAGELADEHPPQPVDHQP